MKWTPYWYIVLALALASLTGAKEPLVSGPKNGARPGPYTFWVSTGVHRGQETCFICETEDRPAVVVFARTPSDALGKLAGKLDKALAEHKAADLRSWITFIGKDHETFDRPLLDWSKQHGLKSLSIGSFKENDGPPTYQVAREADVTVVLFVKKKVQATFGFRENELTDEAVRRVLDEVSRLAEKKP
jgi:hypothetical protein